mgnify:CR=1 FL=1
MITELTRMWLTRSTKPFLFKKEYDQELPFSDCDGLGLYVHIPFCRSICSFCPYCKTLYSEEACSRYIDALIREIHLAGSQIPGKKIVTSLYFGGGTPALAADRIKEIIDAIQEHFIITQGIGIELHPENITPRTLHILKEAGITKLPNLYALKTEYKKLDAERERLSAQYSEAKQKLKEYGIVKQNVDSILRTAPGKEHTQER